MFKHDPELKGSDPEAGLQKESTGDNSTNEQPYDAPNKAESEGNNSPDLKEIAAFAFTAHPVPDLLRNSYAIAGATGEECGAIVKVDDDAHQQALKN